MPRYGCELADDRCFVGSNARSPAALAKRQINTDKHSESPRPSDSSLSRNGDLS